MSQLVETDIADDIDMDMVVEVASLLDDYFPFGLQSPTSAALALGRAGVIYRDAANDDEPYIAATA